MAFFEIELTLRGRNLPTVEAALTEAGATAISYFDRGDEPILEPQPGEFRLWSDTVVRALFDDALDPAACLVRVAAALDPQVLDDATLRRIADRAWEREWLKDWKSMRFGERLWIVPTMAPAPEDSGAILVRLDPGLAFGTGTHPTTALCLETLTTLPLEGGNVLDFGCGSGILAIAALKLGAARALCVDLDPQALAATAANAALNGVADRLATAAAGSALSTYDAVFANILAGTLIEVRERLAAACRPGAALVLSGILASQVDSVVAAYRESFDIVGVSRRDDWCCLRARRRTGPGR
ncbi:MAG: 50S ribosomal protein L11 methyltransferase [Gammaproteobacteria bacterium]|nr:50S ribosomal protein L11 methyltransferase [Gammaproteobacteria bacterium]